MLRKGYLDGFDSIANDFCESHISLKHTGSLETKPFILPEEINIIIKPHARYDVKLYHVLDLIYELLIRYELYSREEKEAGLSPNSDCLLPIRLITEVGVEPCIDDAFSCVKLNPDDKVLNVIHSIKLKGITFFIKKASCKTEQKLFKIYTDSGEFKTCKDELQYEEVRTRYYRTTILRGLFEHTIRHEVFYTGKSIVFFLDQINEALKMLHGATPLRPIHSMVAYDKDEILFLEEDKFELLYRRQNIFVEKDGIIETDFSYLFDGLYRIYIVPFKENDGRFLK